MTTSSTDRHQHNNDAVLAAYRKNRPDAWRQLLQSMTEEEQREVIKRADRADQRGWAAQVTSD